VYDICLTIADRKTIIDVEVDITLFRVGTGNTNTCTCTLNHGSITMDWQLPDIGKTITNTILPSSPVILSIGGSRLFPCISVSCRVIPMDTHWFVYRAVTFTDFCKRVHD